LSKGLLVGSWQKLLHGRWNSIGTKAAAIPTSEPNVPSFELQVENLAPHSK